MLEQVCPILPSRDFDVTSEFYTSIGFSEAYRLAGQYMILTRDAVELHFFYRPGHRPEHSDHGAYVRPADVDALSARIAALGLARDAGFPRFAPAEDKPWGMREAVLWDPDGNILRLGQEI